MYAVNVFIIAESYQPTGRTGRSLYSSDFIFEQSITSFVKTTSSIGATPQLFHLQNKLQ